MKHWLAIVCLFGCLSSALFPVMGAEKRHWAFQPVVDPPVPKVFYTNWCQTPIDRFILAALERNGQTPARPADRRSWLRRASYDLTGLAPTADQLDDFARTDGARAYSVEIERLLNSPHYGEQWGRHWLDVVRYADTAGETADYPVSVAWRYRNYVIDAFNADKPYDEFLREQIAGDILAKRYPSQNYAERVTATGYLAISRRFGFDSENYHHLTIQDTIDTLGQSVLGLTVGCARCHAHKYDPISLSDYYGLYGIFQSTRYAFPGSEQKQKHRALVPLLCPEESRQKWQAFEVRIAKLAQSLETLKQSVPAGTLRSLDELDGDFEMQAPAAGGSNGVLVPPWVYTGPVAITTDAQSPYKNLYPAGRVGVSIDRTQKSYSFTQALLTQQFKELAYINLDFRLQKPTTNQTVATGKHRFGLRGLNGLTSILFTISHDEIAVQFLGKLHTIRKIVPGAWVNLQVTMDLRNSSISGSVGSPGDLSSFGPIPCEPSRDQKLARVFWEGDSGELLPGIAYDQFGIQSTPIANVCTEVPGLANLRDPGKSAEELKVELETLLSEGPFAMAYAVSEGTPQNSQIHQRGEPDQLGDEVPRRLLQVLGGGELKEGRTGSGRLELAQWLTEPRNPLTARVMVNRIWQYHFGQGLVATSNDFGTRGKPPTHPELLDYLASRFVDSGWSIKAMHRLIMASATYQQASRETRPLPRIEAQESEDCPIESANSTRSIAKTARSDSDLDLPSNYSSFPRRRLKAEELRDSILMASRELDITPGREHPFPNPTRWGYTQHGPFNGVYDNKQRTVYLMTQRIKQHPFLALFDAADPNASTAIRRTTTVPTQALYFLNDPFVHASAEHIATQACQEHQDERGQITSTYRRVLGRNPTPDEGSEAIELMRRYRDAAKESGVSKGGQEMAALARILLSSNEFSTVD